MKLLSLRRDDTCSDCSTLLLAGTRACWDAAARRTYCLACATPDAVPSLPGQSAQREYERRSARREVAIRQRHPRLGGLLLALTDDPASTRVWAQGARGERLVAGKIDELAGTHVTALHDRRIPGSRANIDHLAVTASGVWVVDAKTHKGMLEVRRSGGLFSPRVEKLVIAGRDQTKLVAGVQRQVDLVRLALLDVDAPVPVHGVLCFVGTELPWGTESMGGVAIVGRRGLAKLLKRDGELTHAERDSVAAFLASRFPAA